MNNLKAHLGRFAEYYFMVMLFLAGYTPPFTVMVPVIILIGIFGMQLIFKNRALGLTIGILIGLINLYMVFAMISELSHFKTFDASAQKLLYIGSSVFLLNFIMAGFMINKYVAANNSDTSLPVAG
ncbi:MAG: hypothetical protein V4619_14990 [Bacteroidota bacterium]